VFTSSRRLIGESERGDDILSTDGGGREATMGEATMAAQKDIDDDNKTRVTLCMSYVGIVENPFSTTIIITSTTSNNSKQQPP
jgi:hypothetical protein